MMYNVVKESQKKFSVLEVPTNLVVNIYSKRKDAERTAKMLSRGYGFFGNTPQFFVLTASKK